MLPLLLASLAQSSVSGSECPEGYFGVRSSCYKVSETRHDWGTAQEVVKEAFIYPYLLSISTQYCWNRGGYLAEFLSQEEEESLDNLINQDVVYWIGSLTSLMRDPGCGRTVIKHLLTSTGGPVNLMEAAAPIVF